MSTARPLMTKLRAVALALCAIVLLLSAPVALYFAALYAVAASYSGTLDGFFIPAAVLGMFLYPLVAAVAGVFVLIKLDKRLYWGALGPPLANIAIAWGLMSAGLSAG
ncbi:MAG TPA: hypothetical protein VNZ85_11765 [Caulobacter sp.]|nr:hypothetical protein [Caulobacter sp.]